VIEVIDLAGKVALVTGGSRGLGRMHSLVLAEAGAAVAVIGNRNLEKAEEAAGEIRAMGGTASTIKMNLADWGEVESGFAQAKEELGPVDILVNNAAFGIVRATTIVKMDNDEWEKDVRVNLTGPYYCIKAAMPDMIERGWGRIINVSSVTGTMGGFGQCSYAATKAGVIGLTKSIALEGARNGVTCNAVVLGVFDGGSFYEVAEPFKERIIKRVALRRAGNPRELSNVVTFLASEEASYITGEAIEVSGGIGLFTF